MTEQSANNKPSLIEGGLPAKITGIVFWGMVLIGSLAVAMLLHGQDSAQLIRNTGNGMLLAHEIEETIKQQPASRLRPSHPYLTQIAEQLRPGLGFQAIKLVLDKEVWVYGKIHASQSAVSHVLSIPAQAGQPLRQLQVTVYFPSLIKSAIEQRKNTLLGIGVVIILFGLVLQKILQRLLSQPFTNMVSCAQRSADGDMAARFDEDRSDEFGFLAKFINRALDSLTRQRAELQTTLARALQSEAALSWEKERAEVTLHSITDAVITTSATAHIHYMNPAAEALTGWSNQEAHTMPLDAVIQLVHDTSGQPIPTPIYACLHNDAVETLRQHAALLRRDGEKIAVETSAAPMHDDHNAIFGAVMVFQDVRHARRLTHQLTYQASHDLITGLFNRLKFEERLNALLADTGSSDQDHALFYLDLDQFKIVNDTCGHIAGDELLRQVSAALQDEMRKEDTLARLGGDEFGVLLKNCSLDNARIIAEKLRQRIKNLRFGWQDKTFEIGVSIGVVAITPDHPGASGILSTADLSCYTAKDMGRNRIHVYEPTDSTLAQRHGEMCWTTLIVQTLNENRFLLYQQPIRATIAGETRLNHYEILIRMHSPDQSVILPGSFIPAAERYNLMPGIDRWVIRHVFAAIAQGAFGPPDQGEGRMITINLSGASLGDDGLFEFIRATRDEFGIAFSEVCFEITETVAISNLSRATQLIRELRTLGCRFALDDFGSGLSSFAYLKNLPVDYIKIDGGFVKDIVTDPIDRAMVEAIHQIGKIMKIQTIAEWVENEATLSILKEIGVDFAQGFHIGKPQPVQLPTRFQAEVISAAKARPYSATASAA